MRSPIRPSPPPFVSHGETARASSFVKHSPGKAAAAEAAETEAAAETAAEAARAQAQAQAESKTSEEAARATAAAGSQKPAECFYDGKVGRALACREGGG